MKGRAMAPRPEVTVLFVDDEPGWRGGQDSLHTLLEGLWQRHFPFRLACAEGGELARRAREAGWPTDTWKPGGEFSLRNLRFLSGLLRRDRPAIVFYNTPHPAAAGILAGGRSSGRPIQVYARRVDFPLRRNPFSRWKHNRMDACVAISGAVRDTLARGGFDSARITVIPEGFDLAKFDQAPASPLELPGDGPVFGCLAALTPEKGVDVLVRAFARHVASGHQSRLWVAGAGHQSEELHRLAAGLGLGERIRWLGFRPDPAGLARAMDALVMPSRSEGFGRAALYAMAACRPGVASAVGGLLDVVGDGETGLLVPPGEDAALAAALDRLAARPDERQALGQHGRERLEALFTVDRHIERHLRLFQNLLAKKGRS